MTTSQTTVARLLVVDDSIVIRMSLRDLLANEGYEVLLAERGEKGLEMLRSESVHTVILDLVMPGRSGVEVLREIKTDEKLALIPVVMLSAFSDRDDLLACLELGAEDFVVKPWDERELLARLRSMVRLKCALDAAVVAQQTAEAANRSKGEFLTHLSRQIRTPMRDVLGMARLLLDTELNREQRQYVETIQSSGDALLTIINDILDFSKINAGKLDIEPRPFDLQVVTGEVAQPLAKRSQEKGRDDTTPEFVPRQSVAEARTASALHDARILAERTCRVLLAEDSIVNQKVATRMLEKLGCRVDVATNGDEAVAMWAQLPYDVVFMDCQMPELDGYGATGKIREREGPDRHTPIVAMTAGVMERDREACLAAGMDDYINKPVSAAVLAEVLERWTKGLAV